jgi:hypothetical protein
MQSHSEARLESISKTSPEGGLPVTPEEQASRNALTAEREPSRMVKSIVFLGSFGPPSLTVAQSCRAMGISVYLLAPSKGRKQSWLQRSCFSGFRRLDSAAIGTPQGLDAVLAYVSEMGADALTTQSDNHCLWLARNAERFKGVCKLMVPSLHCLESVESKLRQIEAARDAGFSVLPTYVIRGLDDVAKIGSDQYPICLRPVVGDSVTPDFKVRVARSTKELASIVGGISAFGGGIVAQPFLLLPNAILHCTSGEDGELLNCKAFFVDRKFEGVTLRIRPMPVPDGMIGKVAAFSRHFRLSGPYHFEFLYSPGTGEWHYLEVNVRFGGTTKKVTWFGVDEPANCLCAYGLTGPRPPRKYTTMRSAVVSKRGVLKHLLTMLRRGPELWDFPRKPRLAEAALSIGDLLLAKDSVIDWRDLRGSVAFHSQ